MEIHEGEAMLDKVIETMAEGGIAPQDVTRIFAEYAFLTACAISGPSGVALTIKRIQQLGLKAERGDFGAERTKPSHPSRRLPVRRNE